MLADVIFLIICYAVQSNAYYEITTKEAKQHRGLLRDPVVSSFVVALFIHVCLFLHVVKTYRCATLLLLIN